MKSTRWHLDSHGVVSTTLVPVKPVKNPRHAGYVKTPAHDSEQKEYESELLDWLRWMVIMQSWNFIAQQLVVYTCGATASSPHPANVCAVPLRLHLTAEVALNSQVWNNSMVR